MYGSNSSFKINKNDLYVHNNGIIMYLFCLCKEIITIKVYELYLNT